MTSTINAYPNRPWKAARTLTDEHGETRQRVTYRVQGRTASMRFNGRQVIERADVVNFARVPPFRGRYHFVVTFADGATWTIEERAGCGCGGGR